MNQDSHSHRSIFIYMKKSLWIYQLMKKVYNALSIIWRNVKITQSVHWTLSWRMHQNINYCYLSVIRLGILLYFFFLIVFFFPWQHSWFISVILMFIQAFIEYLSYFRKVLVIYKWILFFLSLRTAVARYYEF